MGYRISGPQPDAQQFSQVMKADKGGVIEAGDAKLIIPPGALDQNAVITLGAGSIPKANPKDSIVPVGPSLSVDLGGAKLIQPASLRLPFMTIGTDTKGLVVAETRSDMVEHMHPGTVIIGGSGQPGSSVGIVDYGLLRPGIYGMRWALPVTVADAPSLQVPFYWQAGHPWCSPTATAMTINYYQPFPGIIGRDDAVGGRVSNYSLAGTSHQDISDGSWPAIHMRDLSARDGEQFEERYWDAELIPSDPFTRYVRNNLAGLDVHITLYDGETVHLRFPARPVQTSSDRNVHAFVITGADETRLFINDSNARWDGVHPSMTWVQFRDDNLLRTSNTELKTMVIFAEPRPEEERRGSIELAPGDNREDPNRTALFRNAGGNVISRWRWDGNPYANGYFFDDPTGSLLDDAESGNIIPRTSSFEIRFNVVNLTRIARRYRVEAVLSGRDMAVPGIRRTADIAVPAFNRRPVDIRFGNLQDNFWPALTPGDASVVIELREGNPSVEEWVLQDAKLLRFKLL